MRRQLTYKASWYGSQLAVLDRWWPSSKTCSDCDWQNSRQTLADRVFHCAVCGLAMDRDLNAARNVERHAVVADAHSVPPVSPGTGETQNASGVPIRLLASRGRKQETAKWEGTGPPGTVSPRRSNSPTSPNPRQSRQSCSNAARHEGCSPYVQGTTAVVRKGVQEYDLHPVCAGGDRSPTCGGPVLPEPGPMRHVAPE
ncbi:transposase [Streptomyces laculatispora]|uniref:transposase n=1 Tax=Streptomyces laculatispora TaxID=887464 RepID=UPI001F5E92CA|nr:transposase [Streptomyces laculatispora]